ncbi:hypothetical protein [Rhizobium redzepovicii]|uniref:hypothetical protein n=1 Tax=Rhizobium redzepovicii TaxID=2867518 RepID=UPI001FE58A62|nr:hypothetical protein [Rhizobium redzepovicii]
MTYVWEERARPYVQNGSLIECLTSWNAPEDWLYLYYRRENTCGPVCAPFIEALRV